jgi:hypothetical protein
LSVAQAQVLGILRDMYARLENLRQIRF